MAIQYDEINRTFCLNSSSSSYIMKITKDNYLAHLYWGKSIRVSSADHLLRNFEHSSFSPNPVIGDNIFSLDSTPLEYPAYGNSDYRHPTIEVLHSDGSTVLDLKYKDHIIADGKPSLEGLPHTYCLSDTDAQTLEILLEDSHSGLMVALLYTVFEKLNVITRSVHLNNCGTSPIVINRVLSTCVDFQNDNFDFIHLHGGWSRERQLDRISLPKGTISIESRRGSSSHQHNPFIAILAPESTEDFGDCYGFSFVYSGNFVAQAEVSQYNSTRVTMGINPFDFSWLLNTGETFQAPEVVMVYSDAGLNGMSQTFHDLYRSRLCRGKWQFEPRPVLINNWEATYFDFNEDKIIKIATEAKNLGIEMFVLDDGWFGNRDSDKSSLGDWFVHAKKLPAGLASLADKIHGLGLKFGLWFEPEMVSPDSELYRNHPDWCLHVKGRSRTLGRNQLILDFSRSEVRDYISAAISNILDTVPIDYIKWDMNRNMTEIGSPANCQRETAHRYILGLYDLLDKLIQKYPRILFESCSGGGGRFDPGMLYYMPQTWTSDNTDAVERLKIQFGTSIVYPAIAMGAHVSAVPNHQVHRTTSLSFRSHVAMAGNFGYELDLTKMTNDEKDEVQKQISFYNSIREIVQTGTFYRLKSPFAGNETAWMFVSQNQDEAFVSYFRILSKADSSPEWLKLKGICPSDTYVDTISSDMFHGDELLNLGLPIPRLFGDFQSVIWRLIKK